MNFLKHGSLKRWLVAAAAGLALLTASPALAQTGPAPAAPAGEEAVAPTEYKLENPLGTESIPDLVGRVVTIFTGISGSFALLMFIYGGALWIFSGGSEERVTKGKEVMKWATIGMAVMFGAYLIVRTLFSGLGAISEPTAAPKARPRGR
jgi:hypothetical protein